MSVHIVGVGSGCASSLCDSIYLKARATLASIIQTNLPPPMSSHCETINSADLTTQTHVALSSTSFLTNQITKASILNGYSSTVNLYNTALATTLFEEKKISLLLSISTIWPISAINLLRFFQFCGPWAILRRFMIILNQKCGLILASHCVVRFYNGI